MSRSFDFSAEYDASVERVRAVFGDKTYWLARLADSGSDETRLDALEVGTDGSVRVATTQVLRRDRLPGIAAQFIRGDLSIKREEAWSAARDGAATAATKASIPGAPAKVDGTVRLAGKGSGARAEYHVTVEVGVPLVGGKLEDVIRNELKDLLAAEQRFTAAWLTQHP